MDSYERKDLLLCLEGLGKVLKLEEDSDEGKSVTWVYHKGPDALGTFLILSLDS